MEETPEYISVVTEIDPMEEDSWSDTDSSSQRLLQGYTINGVSIPMVESVDTLVIARTSDGIMDTTRGMRPVHEGQGREQYMQPPIQTIPARNRLMTVESPWDEEAVRVRSNRALPVEALERIRASRNAVGLSTEQLPRIISSQAADEQQSQSLIISFPYSEAEQHQAQEQRAQREYREQRQPQEEQQHRVQRSNSTDTPSHTRTSTISVLPFPEDQRREVLGHLNQNIIREIHVSQERQDLQAITTITAGSNITTSIAHNSPSTTSIPNLFQQQNGRVQNHVRGELQPHISLSISNSSAPSHSVHRQSSLRGEQPAPASQPLQSTSSFSVQASASDPNISSSSNQWQTSPSVQFHVYNGTSEPQMRPQTQVTWQAHADVGHPNSPGTPPPQIHVHAHVHTETQSTAHDDSQAQAQSEVRLTIHTTNRTRHRREYELEDSPSPMIDRAVRSDTDHQFQHLLSRYHHRAASPTPSSRLLHLWLRSSRAMQPSITCYDLGIMPYHPGHPVTTSTLLPLELHGIARHQLLMQLEAQAASSSSSSHPPPPSPRPLTRQILQYHASNPLLNPRNLPWNALSFVLRCQRARIRSAARTATTNSRSRQDTALARLERERTIQRLEAEAVRVDEALTNLALCSALSDSRTFLAEMERAEEAERDSDAGWALSGTSTGERRGAQRWRERGWVLSRGVLGSIWDRLDWIESTDS